jgi:xylulokinase
MAHGKTYLLGIDAGTTSIKALILDSDSKVVASAGQEYTLDTGSDDSCELDPEVYWKITCAIIRELLQKSKIDPALVKGLAFSSQGETIIAVDKNGKPLRKAIIWLDNRSGKEAKILDERFDKQHLMEITGQPEIQPLWPATRILWLKENEPEIFKQVGKFLLVEDYLLFRLTGKFCTEYSLVSSTLYFDFQRKIWWDEMLSFLGISPEQLPDLHPSGSVIGELTSAAASATGLTAKTLCVTGSYDHPAGAIGAGNIAPGMVTLTIGASMAMCVTLDKPITDASNKLPCQCHALKDLYFLLPYGQTAGMVLKWFKDEFCLEEIEKSKQLNCDPYDLIVAHAEEVSAGAEGLLMLPHLMGTGSPEFNANMKGVFAGIQMGMKKGHFVRAIIESVIAMTARNIEMIADKGIAINTIYMLGGGAKNRIWSQTLADMTGIPVATLTQTENASMGAALIAGVGVGIFKDFEIACGVCVKLQARYEPNPANYAVYRKVYSEYIKLYESLKNFW